MQYCRGGGETMDIKQIRKIIELMKANELCEFEMEEEGFRIAIKRRNGNESQVVLSNVPTSPMVAASSPVAAATAALASAAAEKAEEKKYLEVKSPIVGTFYRSPSPDAEPYVVVGSEIEPESVVCIVEAMKVMNEIKAEVKGIVHKILVDNATPIQFGQVLFLVEPV
jgi:acetyl-CoA carboxylase biotin carboxyl carrier protein